MTRRARRRRPQEENRAKGFLFGGIGIAIIACISVGAVLLNLNKREVDRTNGCPTNHYDSVTAVLIDLTDKITPTQAAALRNALAKIRSDVSKYGRLEIYLLAPTTTNTLEPIFAACSPGSGRDVDSKLYGNPELADRVWRKQFSDKLDLVLADLIKTPNQDTSPIFEGIQSVGVTAFGPLPATQAAKKRLVIVSDMLQHTTQMSLYQGAPSFASFGSSQYFAKVRPMLRGAEVDVLLLVRDTRLNAQKPPLYKFWIEYVAAGDGFLRDWEPLQ